MCVVAARRHRHARAPRLARKVGHGSRGLVEARCTDRMRAWTVRDPFDSAAIEGGTHHRDRSRREAAALGAGGLFANALRERVERPSLSRARARAGALALKRKIWEGRGGQSVQLEAQLRAQDGGACVAARHTTFAAVVMPFGLSMRHRTPSLQASLQRVRGCRCAVRLRASAESATTGTPAKPKVIVVGGGWAGFGAAKHLVDQGVRALPLPSESLASARALRPEETGSLTDRSNRVMRVVRLHLA